MNAYQFSLIALGLGLLGQSVACGVALECFFHKAQPAASRRRWLLLAVAALLLGLHHGYALELALKTGLYDLRQALLVGCAGLLAALALTGISRRS